MVPVSYNARSLMVRKVTTFATAIGIAFVVFVYAGSQMLEEGVRRGLVMTGRRDVVVILRKGSDAELSSQISNDSLRLFGSHPQVAQASGVIGETVAVVSGEHNDGSGLSNVLIRGMPANGIAFRPEVEIVRGRAPRPGTDEVIVGKAIAGRFKGLDIGGSFDLRRNRPLNVVGVFAAGGSTYEAEVWGDLDKIRTSLGREGIVSSARVRLNSPADFDAYRSAIENDPQFSMKAAREDEFFAKQTEQTGGFLVNMIVFMSALFAIAAMIGAAITMNGAVAHRVREIGTLRALGFSGFSIMVSFLLEAIVLSLLGGAFGCVVVLLLSFKTFPIVNFQTFSEIVISFRATPWVMGKALILAVVMGLIGGLIPAIRAARISPVEAMRG